MSETISRTRSAWWLGGTALLAAAATCGAVAVVVTVTGDGRAPLTVLQLSGAGGLQPARFDTSSTRRSPRPTTAAAAPRRCTD